MKAPSPPVAPHLPSSILVLSQVLKHSFVCRQGLPKSAFAVSVCHPLVPLAMVGSKSQGSEVGLLGDDWMMGHCARPRVNLLISPQPTVPVGGGGWWK